uniref:Protein FAM161A n=1 Tax=Astyanax mexicanus TaxID=7994 RepID=A0A3B1IP88_ASTMX
MSPTTRNQNCEDLQVAGYPIMRTQKLEASELQALYGEDRDEDEEQQVEVELPGERIAEEGVNEFTYLSDMPPHSRRQSYRQVLHKEVFFSNEAYYCRLEELKKTHLKNIADLQRLYLNQVASAQKDRQLEDKDQDTREQVASRPQPRDDTHQKLIGSDQSDTSVEEQVSEPEDEPEWENPRREPHVKQALLTPPTNPPPQKNWCPFLKISSSPSPANQQSRQVEKVDTRRRGSKVTIPQPFHMTLREEERKLHRVKTRSEVELENERLRKELDELKECGRKFRATPAPVSTHLAPYEIVKTCHSHRQPDKEHVAERPVDGHLGSHRLQKKPSQRRCAQEKPSHRRRVQNKASPGHCIKDKSVPGRRLQAKRHSAPPLPQQPFSFIERERKKKEMKLLAELNNLTPREERRVFKARPVPRSLYRCNSQDFQLYGAISLHSRAQEHRLSSTAPSDFFEESQQEEEVDEEEGNEDNEVFLPHRGWGEKMKKVKKEQNGERERDWSYIHPLRRASASQSQEVLPACKSDYISVKMSSECSVW